MVISMMLHHEIIQIPTSNSRILEDIKCYSEKNEYLCTR